MRCEQEVRGPRERVPGQGRLGRQHVEGGATKLAAAQSVRERALVDEAATCSVEHDGAFGQERQLLRSDEPARLLGQRNVDGEDVGAREQLVERQRSRSEAADVVVRDDGIVCRDEKAEAPGTLREAIRALVAMNILVSRHGDGTYVSSLDPDSLSRPFSFVLETRPALLPHLFEARRLLESACAGLAAERITDEEVAELAELAATPDDVGPDELIDRDVALHTAIVRATGNPILAGLAGSIGALGLDSRRDSAGLPGQARRTRVHHKRIVAALRRRAPEEAEAAMAAHLRSVERALARAKVHA